MSATCKSCGAAIIWVKTANGKNAPIDAKPEKRFVPSGADLARGQISFALVDTYASHFSTCPQADQHRKAKP